MLGAIMQDPSERPHASSYYAYLVRLWQDSPKAAWRASAQPVHSGEIVRFADLDALFEFMLAQTTSPVSQTEEDPIHDEPHFFDGFNLERPTRQKEHSKMKTRSTLYTRFQGRRVSVLAALALTLALAPVAPRLARAAGGTVVGWGNNVFGQTSIPAGLNDAIAIAAGNGHSLALRSDGTVLAWGNNTFGQSDVPAGLTNVVAIAGGASHSLALKSDGTVVAWGCTPFNNFGQCDVPAGLSGVTAIAAGGYHNLVLKNDGTVVAWGENGDGQTDIPAGLSGVTAVAGGNTYSLVLKSDGTVVAWGFNGNGQTNVPAGLSGVAAIAAGSNTSLALKSDGTVVAWGRNFEGQTNVPAGLSNVVAIAGGASHSLALKSDGTVVAWGCLASNQGQCAVPAGLSGVTAISAGSSHSLALQGMPVDTTPPVITPNMVGALGNNGWYVGDITVSWSVTDAESAITAQSGCDAVTINADTAGSTLTCSATSSGGTSTQSVTIQRDATAPTLAPAISPNPVLLGGVATATSGAADALSGLASQSCGALDTSTVGAKTVTCTATDNAGNTATANANYSVIYNWSGFFQPVVNLPVLNQVKAGQAIPVKFSLAGNQGLAIFATGSPSSQGIACDGGAPLADIEQTVSAGNSSLQYDAGTGVYTYVWKTQKGWANTCRQLIVTLADGTQHLANFKFK